MRLTATLSVSVVAPGAAAGYAPLGSAGSYAELRGVLTAYQQPHIGKAAWQLANTFGPFFICLYTAWSVFANLPWASAPFVLICSSLLLRIYSIQHDCSHGSFLPSQSGNDAVGHFCGIVTLTPYLAWRRLHGGHHAVSNDLDRRTGQPYDDCLTVDEYLSLRWMRRALYRASRSPLVLFLEKRAPFIRADVVLGRDSALATVAVSSL